MTVLICRQTILLERDFQIKLTCWLIGQLLQLADLGSPRCCECDDTSAVTMSPYIDYSMNRQLTGSHVHTFICAILLYRQINLCSRFSAVKICFLCYCKLNILGFWKVGRTKQDIWRCHLGRTWGSFMTCYRLHKYGLRVINGQWHW